MKISELTVGSMCDITLVVKSATARETRAKKPYLALQFFDGVSTINANYWDWSSGNIPEVNAVLDVRAQVTEWQGTKQLNIKSMVTNKTVPLTAFMPKAAEADAAEHAYAEAYALACDMLDDTLRSLTLGIFEALREQWLIVPGAKGIHHAYVGGTIIHSLGVAKLAGGIADCLGDAVNKDLCIAGALLHDVGKLFTYKIDGVNIGMTDEGMLLDHIFMGAEFVGNFAENIIDCDDYANNRKLRLLRHIILAHHGHKEYGSPVVPMCLEAMVVHAADGLDASTDAVRQAASKVPETQQWTDRVFSVNNTTHLTPRYIKYIMTYSQDAEEASGS